VAASKGEGVPKKISVAAACIRRANAAAGEIENIWRNGEMAAKAKKSMVTTASAGGGKSSLTPWLRTAEKRVYAAARWREESGHYRIGGCGSSFVGSSVRQRQPSRRKSNAAWRLRLAASAAAMRSS
jgi:hypothetical protein